MQIYAYDYRTRRVTRTEPEDTPVTTQIVFDGGTSIEEYTSSAASPTVEYVRGHDYGGGVGGLEYTIRGGLPNFNFYDSRGDVTTQTNSSGAVTFQTAYEAFGNETVTDGSTLDRQKASTKEQDPTGLLNEGFRYRDPSTGTFLTRDPLGFKDGLNVYTYVRQNPWTKFDPEGLFETFVDQAARGWHNLTHQSIGTTLSTLGHAAGLDQAAVGASRLAHGDFHAMGQSLAQVPGQVAHAISDNAHAAAAGASGLAHGQFSKTQIADAVARGAMNAILTFGGPKVAATGIAVENTARETSFLKAVAQRAEDKIGGSGAAAGTEKHAYAAKLVDRYQNQSGKQVGRGLSTEQNYRDGDHLERRNEAGSVRLDVVAGNVKSPAKVYDYKFTKAPNPTMSSRRVNQIQEHSGVKSPPVVIHPPPKSS